MEVAARTVIASQVGEAVEDVGEGVAKAWLNSFILASEMSLAGDGAAEEGRSTPHQRHE
jgi:hypothetical protein